MDVPTLRRREKGVVVRLESHCSDHCPARFLRGLVPSGRRSALIAGMGRRGGRAQGRSGVCRTWCPAPPAVRSSALGLGPPHLSLNESLLEMRRVG